VRPEREGYRAASEYVVAESLERSCPWAIGASSGTWNLVWNFGRSLPGFQASMISVSSMGDTPRLQPLFRYFQIAKRARTATPKAISILRRFLRPPGVCPRQSAQVQAGGWSP